MHVLSSVDHGRIAIGVLCFSGHQKKLMLAVKRLCDLQRSHNHPDRTGGGTPWQNLPTTLELVAIEHNMLSHIQSESPSNGGCTSPRTARTLLSFQDSELSAELQNAMTGNAGVGEAFDLRSVASAAMSVSQESIGARSRGSGNSSSGKSHSHQSLLLSAKTSSNTESPIMKIGEGDEVRSGGSRSKERVLQRPTDMWEFQSQSVTSNKLPFSPLTPPQTLSKKSHFVYPAVPPKSKHIHLPNHLYQPHHTLSSTSSLSPQSSPTSKTYSNIHTYKASTHETPSMQPSKLPGAVGVLEPQHNQNPTNYDLRGPHKKRTLSLTRFNRSDSEPAKGDDLSTPYTASSSVVMPSYATLLRKAGRGHANAVGLHHHISRSHSFAVRSQRKGPPPPPPKRISSVSGSPCQTGNEKIRTEMKGEVEASNMDNVQNIAARLEGNSRSSSPSRRIDIPPNTIPVSPVFSPVFSLVPHGMIPYVKPVPGLGPGALRMTESERTEESKSQRFGDAKGALKNDRMQKSESTTASLNHSCASHLPFAEEGILTIKQRPRVVAAPEGPTLTLKGLMLPEFNLKESDTVKRRHKPKHSLTTEEVSSPHRENSQPQISSLHMHTDSTLSENESQSTEDVFQTACSLKKAPKPPVSSKPFSPHKQSLTSNPATPQKTLSASHPSAQTAIPNLTNIQIHTVSPKLGSNIHAQASTSVLNPEKLGKTVTPQMEKCTALSDLMGSQSCSTIGKGDQLLFFYFLLKASFLQKLFNKVLSLCLPKKES